jgi:hypothetical protein
LEANAMQATQRIMFALLAVMPLACAKPTVTGVTDIKWSKALSGNIVYGSVSPGTAAISADVPPAHVRACVDGVVKGLGTQEGGDVRAARRLAPMTENLTREMVRLLRDTGATFLSVEKNVFRFAVSNTRPYTFSCRTPFGTASFTLESRWASSASAEPL